MHPAEVPRFMAGRYHKVDTCALKSSQRMQVSALGNRTGKIPK
jgi:hypothetical protein